MFFVVQVVLVLNMQAALIVLNFVLTWNFVYFCNGSYRYFILAHKIKKSAPNISSSYFTLTYKGNQALTSFKKQ